MICIACRSWYNYQTDECGNPLRTGGAHVVSKGAGGTIKVDLCYECHANVMHQKGWSELERKYPHIINRLNKIREQEYENNR